MGIRTLERKVKNHNPKADLELIRRAFIFAKNSHINQHRRSGELFILHPLGVANILADLGLDTQTIIAALLHDVVEDTELTLDDVENKFGPEIRMLIDGVTKLEKIEFKSREEKQAENLRKMLMAMAQDIRVILIKLADRLHNMRTLSHLSPEKQTEKASETLEIYAPLANRLGISRIKWELEDLAFSVLEPKKYAEIRKMVAERLEKREAYLNQTVKAIKKELKKVGIVGEIEGRPKHFYSIYQKMMQKNRDFDEIYDLIGIRISVDTVKDCYAALGTIHALWKPIPGRFKDYIGMPKFNMYQSLHTTVIGPLGRPLEIQIRTEQMHKTAEYGIAAHWRYKEKRKKDSFDEKLSWLRQILEWQNELKDPREFMENLKIDLFQDEVFIFTPKGEVMSLPAGATPLDFAYAIHTEVGHRCIGAKANNQIVPLEYELQMGDIVEILTSKVAGGPGKDWLNIAKTSRARNKIKQWFSKERKEDDEQLGREIFQKLLRQKGLTQTSFPPELLEAVSREFNFAKLDNLYSSIGAGNVSPKQILTRMLKQSKKLKEEETTGAILADVTTQAPVRTERKVGVRVKGVDGALIKLATCCNPVPKDEIIGFVTRGKGISVHRKSCPNAKELLKDADRMIEVYWDAKRGTTFKVEIEVEALDRKKLLRDVSTVISDSGVNIISASATITKDQTALFRFLFEVGSAIHLENILKSIKKIDAVFDAYRVLSQ
ncbi:MAG TPA: bifunctional (p)ppGpp synthetase/guanosine-3',5'-bis(diphosphate) 3'-pyrophosphohydrolase [Candidatus Subteraquimicrobiales bacterium]